MSNARLDRRLNLSGKNTLEEVGLPYLPDRSSVDMLKVPYVDLRLIDWLRHHFPKTLSRDRSLRDYDINVGHLEVIAHLEALHADQLNKK